MEDLFMMTSKKLLGILLISLFGIMAISSHAASADESVTLYTPYTKISVSPGESIDYPIEVINNSKEIQNVEISVEGMPKGWVYIIKSGTWTISQLSILPGENKSFSLKVDVPLRINKGNYHFKVLAGGSGSLPLTVTVSEQGTFKTEFTSQQSNMQGNANASFTFTTNLKNRTPDMQLYALMAEPPRGWTVTFKSSIQPLTAIPVESNVSAPLAIEVKPPDRVPAGSYKIPVSAATNATSASLVLEVVIVGSYNIELSTPTGLLSTKITAGDYKRVELVVNNTGSSDLNDVKFEFSAPVNWDVTFDPKKVDKLQPGKTAQVFATIKADKKAIPGDYVAILESKTLEVSSKISFRISVETRLLWGWVGVLIIIAALGSVYYLFRKYGRR
jgi:uncharacterized membrane protein